MEEIKLNIGGMHCTGCSSRLEKVLNGLDGVKNATVSLDDKQADIKYLSSEISLDKIKEAVEDAGFTVDKI